MRHPFRHRFRRAFTHLELLVVVAIAAILLTLLLPAIQHVRELANRTVCTNNLHQIGVALRGFEEIHEAFPMALEAERGAYWTAFLLPYLEREDIYKQLTFYNEGAQWAWTPMYQNPSLDAVDPKERNIAACSTVFSFYRCPSTAAPLFCTDTSDYIPPWFVAKRVPINYLGCASGRAVDDFRPPASPHISQLDGIMIARAAPYQLYFPKGPGHIRRDEIADGLSNTIIVGESEPFIYDNITREDPDAGRIDHWALGGDDCDNWEGTDWSESCGSTGVPLNFRLPANPTRADIGMAEVAFGSQHRSGAFVLFADGSVRFATNAITPSVWSALGTRRGGEVAAPDF